MKWCCWQPTARTPRVVSTAPSHRHRYKRRMLQSPSPWRGTVLVPDGLPPTETLRLSVYRHAGHVAVRKMRRFYRLRGREGDWDDREGESSVEKVKSGVLAGVRKRRRLGKLRHPGRISFPKEGSGCSSSPPFPRRGRGRFSRVL